MYSSENDISLVFEKEAQYSDLRERLLHFAVDSIKFIKTLPGNKEFDVLKYQYSKSATSIGANYEEAQSSTYKEFLAKLRISLREANESKYWLKIMNELNIGQLEKRKLLMSEIEAITKILGSITSKVDKKIKGQSNV
jgi:four helix bundle protein